MTSYDYFVLLGVTQLLHSQEEIWTGFHKRWFVFKMPRWVFVSFEILFSLTIIAYILRPDLPLASVYMPAFALIMLINGVGHVVWALVVRQYVPGLVTAPFFIAIFAMYYAQLLTTGWSK